jgi:ketosteroid isomerase-like protein
MEGVSMHRRTLFTRAATAAAGLVLMTSHAVAQLSDTDKVKASLDAFTAALSARDLAKMEAVWAPDATAMLINPRDKAPTIGWDGIKKKWAAVFGAWSELKVTRTGETIRVVGPVAWMTGTADVVGKAADGTAMRFSTLWSDVYEKRGENWLIVSHSAWRVPE